MKGLHFALVVPLAFTFAISPSSAQEKLPEIVTKNSIVYGNGGKEKLMLDLALPKGKGPFPLVVCIHGGGWRSGKRQQLTLLTKMLARKGFAAATISYRLAPKHKFPAQIEDCKAAIRFLRANAKKYHFNPKRVGVVGFSAGAHLACLLGAADRKAGLEGNGGNGDQSSRVQAVVSFFGPTDFIKRTWNADVEKQYLIPFLGDTYEKATKKYIQASPLKYVSKDDPPFLFIHGDKDKLVGIYHSKIMAKKLKKVGVPARLEVVEGAGHGWLGLNLIRSLNQTIEFFEEKLKK